MVNQELQTRTKIIAAFVAIISTFLIALTISEIRYNNLRNRIEAAEETADTVYCWDTVFYSRADLAKNTYRLNVPNIGTSKLVYVAADSTKIVYKDSIRYIASPREFYYTSIGDVEIWHSGIDSTIDSLNVARKTEIITKTIQPVTKRNALSLGVEADYDAGLKFPLHLEYSYKVNRLMSVYSYGEYDLLSKQFEIGWGINVMIAW